MTDEQLIERVKLAIENAEVGVSRVSKAARSVGGFTSEKIRDLLNNLCRNANNYLEIGLWQGASFVAANCNNKLHHSYGCDNFSQFNPDGTVKLNLYKNLESINWEESDTIFKIIDKDCFTLTIEDIPEKVDLIYYDGDHGYESQKNAVTYFSQFATDIFIMCTDDYRWPDVRRGTEDGIKESGLKIVFQQEMLSTKDGDTENYWNGWMINILKK